MAEWSKASDSSSDIFGCVSSNLTECTVLSSRMDFEQHQTKALKESFTFIVVDIL